MIICSFQSISGTLTVSSSGPSYRSERSGAEEILCEESDTLGIEVF